MLSRSLAGTVALMEHKPESSSSAALSVPLDDHMNGYFVVHSAEETVSRILHFHSQDGQKAIEAMRQRMRDSGQYQHLSECDKWLPTMLPPGEATRLLMRASRANTVIQHGGIGKAARTDLGQIIMQELFLRDEHENEKKDATKPDKSNDDDATDPPAEVNEPPPYDPETDPNFYAGSFTIDFADLERSLPTRPPPVKLEAPRIGVNGGAWIPNAEQWAEMDEHTRAKVRSEVESSRAHRMQLGTAWQVPEAEIHVKRATPKKKNKNKPEPGKDEGVDSDEDPSATQKPVRSVRRNSSRTALSTTKNKNKGASKANTDPTGVTEQPAKKRRRLPSNESTLKLSGSATGGLTATGKGSSFAQLLTGSDDEGEDGEHPSKPSDAMEDEKTVQETPSEQPATTPASLSVQANVSPVQTSPEQPATTLAGTLAVPLILGASAPLANTDVRRSSRRAKKPDDK